ncbi:helix-turn-helix domain-containing protein [Flavobacterium collinsii]|jgi:AraC family transcriptional activator of pobA|uniref:HTH-type transcriptional activator RhaS n=1 Tax=Flavobacterium collinsii TaxID=1114861 RepID=A0A9W4THW2_9FLAO|nr:helix-turn-helix domain-containing protein [Flavobacterium collinsii]GIQ61127.1 AraC family transcriptional regulator [Flavobacterium collinsii]CAI2767853.1 HTH-type transcriptional activator RhaS [Flavobacterium collinsii]
MKEQLEEQGSELGIGDLKLKGFKVYEVNGDVSKIPTYNRRDFYKICINTSKSFIHYADRGIETDGTILFFGNPHIPYSWEIISPSYEGYACVFTEDFLKVKDRSESLHESPLFKIGGTPIFSLSVDQKLFIDSLFQKMIEEQETDYIFKDDLIRNYINLILHESMKMQPSENFFKPRNASSRITSLFLELLERQFPIETKNEPLALKTPQDYAQSLAVHVNHLNRSVKEITGKPTTTHISERIVGEAKALLQHTDWSISDIGYSLGFEYPSYFNNYFKRITGTIPKSLRV